MSTGKIRDEYEYLTRNYLRSHGIEPGRRNDAIGDPQLTYQSDLIEEEAARILKSLDELVDVLADHIPRPIAQFLAYATIHWPEHKGSQPEPWCSLARACDEALSELVYAQCERESGL